VSFDRSHVTTFSIVCSFVLKFRFHIDFFWIFASKLIASLHCELIYETKNATGNNSNEKHFVAY
jgi:hypothetical protein